MANDFTAQIADWVTKTEGAMEGVFHESAQRVSEEMNRPRGNGGNLPVDTGFLWHSQQASTEAPPQIDPAARPAKGASYSYDAGPVSLVINGAELGQSVYICFTAAYAARVNYGFTGEDSLGRHYSQQGAFFVEQAAQQWPQIVAQVAAELKDRIG